MKRLPINHTHGYLNLVPLDSILISTTAPNGTPTIHTQIPFLHLAQVLEQKTPLEIGIRMQNRIQLTSRP